MKTFYIVAGDEMQKLFKEKYPSINTIAFRENLSEGNYEGYQFSEEFINNRSSFWKVSKEDYVEKMSPIMELDISNKYVLCFGNDKCCVENLKFVIHYLKEKGYSHRIKVQIVNEVDLTIIDEYII